MACLGPCVLSSLVDFLGRVAVVACCLSFHAWLVGVTIALLSLMVCVARPQCACLSPRYLACCSACCPARFPSRCSFHCCVFLLFALIVALLIAVLVC